MHSNSTRDALARFETMIGMGMPNLSDKNIREMIARALDLVIQVDRLADGSRRLLAVTEVVGMEGSVVTTQDIFVSRDPRTIGTSKLREEGQPAPPGMFLQKFRRFRDRSLRAELADYAPWLRQAGWRVRYEALVTSATTMEGLALYLGVPYVAGAFDELPGLTRTWTGQPSDYRTIWTPEVEHAWNHEGGLELLKVWGYR